METSQYTQINIPDLRQSENWAKYLQTLGWKSFRTSGGVNVEVMKTLVGGLSKIQRPTILNSKDLAEIEKVCREHRALFIKIEPGLGQNLETLKTVGFLESFFPMLPPSTIFIDLEKSEYELWNALSGSGKYSVRRAQREGAKMEYYKNPPENKLAEFSKIAQATARKKKFYVGSLKDYKNKVEIFGDDAHLVMVYTDNGELAGGNLYLGHKDNVWFMHGGTSEIGRKGKDGYELLWKSFLYLKAEGYKILDLEGRDDERFPNFTKTWGGFSHFKEKFGGENVVFPTPFVKPLNPLIKMLVRISPTTML